ncbi:hypothetical protein REMIM1_PC00139 (plasmid) [Rhizobium etli bv. mimosae str. Mim1]|nr:hypothetical protein REMIM1_PC00139 [Rhizobium etli bv. mimosae str. Mim1]
MCLRRQRRFVRFSSLRDLRYLAHPPRSFHCCAWLILNAIASVYLESCARPRFMQKWSAALGNLQDAIARWGY